jgi:hypothetical protein
MYQAKQQGRFRAALYQGGRPETVPEPAASDTGPA